jgi:lipoyl synthase
MPALKPAWLDKKIDLQASRDIKCLLRGLSLHTVCEEAQCPNIGECFSKKTATFMILGDSCTRNCAFCGVLKKPPQAVDYDEPDRVAQAVTRLDLDYVVITSPTRDDLSDGGAEIFSKTVDKIKKLSSKKRVEILVPDFLGNTASIRRIALCRADVIAHNLETCPSLYIRVRKGADYRRSLKVLESLKRHNKAIRLKSGLMLGLGEKEKEVTAVLEDLRQAGCDILTLGQYLPPSHNHYPVKAYIPPQRFQALKELAYNMGFAAVKSAPYVRSSYQAHSCF